MDLPDFLTQEPDGDIHVTGHRIGIKHIVDRYNEGYSPVMLLEEYPTLSLPIIHKSIAFYLENKTEVDAYIAECEAELDRQQAAAKKGPDLAELRRRMAAMERVQGK
jgi:uncharacterized protein (DUF433 family)